MRSNQTYLQQLLTSLVLCTVGLFNRYSFADCWVEFRMQPDAEMSAAQSESQSMADDTDEPPEKRFAAIPIRTHHNYSYQSPPAVILLQRKRIGMNSSDVYYVFSLQCSLQD